MQKLVTIHQPNYLPWIGFFSKVSMANCLILYDDAQYEKNGPINRNKIRMPAGSAYLTIPVGHIAEETNICDVKLPADKNWQRSHWKLIHDIYAKSDFFRYYEHDFDELYRREYKYLQDINEAIIILLLKCFQIDVEIIRASEMDIDPALKKTDRMIGLLKSAGATAYLSGPSGRKYLEFEKFKRNNLELYFAAFTHPVYPQRFPGFEPNLAAIDLLFSIGPQSSELINHSGKIERYTREVSCPIETLATQEVAIR